ncbi:Glycosyltransferase involved in cell wall bisynthesis [Caminicella sporogenes DSM 14501]|uniref:Glycosyltransferase involved in cell wall bisynthesis n=1 Tax=Caminicella sporogenes DSM 14501 TaxID=1121266 RepID=A0A1M6QGB4_9FIRM|nr:glycosyltransferase [Caminicella sporogenes]RKD25320.1 glycosyl transferase family 1 [Caminicella sporogenes]SHK19354.1 Glycosyltransferase involved in cell wall bisynthesis [Caminicella sporogenes DSM 14501]
MKVLHLISGGDTGGAKTHVINLLKELQKHIDIELICFLEGDFSKEARKQGINIKVYEQKSRLDFSAVKKLINTINSEKFDIIHSHGARANFISLLIKLFLRKTVITTIHSDYRLDDFIGSHLKNVIFRNINAFSLRFMDYYIGVSDNFKEMLISRGFSQNKVFSVYNGIDFNKEINYVSRDEFFKNHGIKNTGNEIWIGIMGRLDPVKGQNIFLEGASKAYKKNKNLRFLLAGDGEERENLKKYARELGIEKATYFLGFINNPFDFFNAIDINTITSYSESFPYVILEGAKLKKPTISSDVGGIKDIIFHGKTGYLFKKGDSQELSNLMLKLASEKEDWSRLGNNLYEYVKNNFSTEIMAKRHIEIYKSIISSKF